MTPALAVDVVERVRGGGFALIDEPIDDSAFVRLARELGEVIDDTLVRVVPGRKTYLANPEAIPFHTDYPAADIVAWRCEAQDDNDGASLLVDGFDVLDALDEATRTTLESIALPAMIRLGDEPLPTTVLSRRRGRRSVFFAPWLGPLEKHEAGLSALRSLRVGIDRQGPRARSMRLTPGQVLVVDNHRMLHGRRRLMPTSSRRLRRLWIAEISSAVGPRARCRLESGPSTPNRTGGPGDVRRDMT